MSSKPSQPPSHPEGKVPRSLVEPISSQRHVSGAVTAPRRVVTTKENEDRRYSPSTLGRRGASVRLTDV